MWFVLDSGASFPFAIDIRRARVLGLKISLYDPQTYTYSGTYSGAGESIPLTLRDGHLFVPAKIEMPGRPRLDGQFLVDTGGGLVTAVLTTPFAQSSNLPSNLPAPTQRAILVRASGRPKIAQRFIAGTGRMRDEVRERTTEKGRYSKGNYSAVRSTDYNIFALHPSSELLGYC